MSGILDVLRCTGEYIGAGVPVYDCIANGTDVITSYSIHYTKLYETFGDSERDGITRDNRFYDKPLDFSLTFPENWRIENQQEKILAISPDNDGLIQMSIADLNKRIPPKQFMQQRMRLKNLRQGSTFETGDLEGYTAIADSNTTFGVRAVRYAVIYRNSSAYIFACTAKDNKNPRSFDDAMLATAGSFRRLTAADKPYARENKIAVIRAPRGASYAIV